MATNHRTSHSAMWKDAWRSIAGNGKRFAAIATIVAVGVMMMGGLNSIGTDLKAGLDDFFDTTSVHDISIASTYGFSDDDIKALRGVDGVSAAAGERTVSATTKVGGNQASATVTSLNQRRIDEPYLTAGHLPQSDHEIVVTQQYLDDSGKAIGGTLTFTPEETTSFAASLASGASDDSSGATSDSSDSSDSSDAIGAADTFMDGDYTIVGTVINPNDIVAPDGPLAMISGAKTVYPFFVSEDSVANEGAPYTSALITATYAKPMNTYEDDYLTLIDSVLANVEHIRSDREQERTEEVKAKIREPFDKQLNEQKAKLAALPDGDPMRTAGEQRIAQADSTMDAKLGDLPQAKWIIQDRGSMTSYEDVKTESEMIERLGTLFPILFLVIAILVSLTAVARMVEEDRQLIGTYKALGYSRYETMVKYLLYSALACLVGGVVGDLFGLAGLPYVFTNRLLKMVYVLPSYPLIIDWATGIGGILLFLVIITGAAVFVCADSLRLFPAELLRPKAPKAGKTIFLQRIGLVWNHLSFLGKVTARNLFRYKSRALMVIVGVLGCTALMTAGFGMGTSALTLMPRQFDEVAGYDVMAMTASADHDDSQKALDGDADVKSTMALHVESATLSSTDDSSDTKMTVTLMVVPDGESLDGWLDLHTTKGDPIALKDKDGSSPAAIVTVNAATNLGLKAGSKVNAVDATMNTADIGVLGVAQYYTGNVMVMTETAYRDAFGTASAGFGSSDADLQLNADFIKVKGDDDAQIAFADDLASQDEYLSVSSAAKQIRDFSQSFLIFFVMIGFIVVMAAILAVVVLYTLASTNISERERELATLKVLGFRRGEVRGYVNKEMLLLSGIGIVIGLPCGLWLLDVLVSQINLPGMNIVPNIAWYCYVAAAALAFGFALLVGWATNGSLDRIDMVGALKSPE